LLSVPFTDAPISQAPQTRRGIVGVGGEEPELRVSLAGVSCVGTTTIGRILDPEASAAIIDSWLGPT